MKGQYTFLYLKNVWPNQTSISEGVARQLQPGLQVDPSLLLLIKSR